MSGKHEKLAYRLARIISRLNDGERLDIHQLKDEFQVSIRILQKDLNERLDFLEDKFIEKGRRYYLLDKNKLGHLTSEDVQRFATFCSIQNLFPKIDSDFYKNALLQSVQIKGFQYEELGNRLSDFKSLQEAIDKHRIVEFHYTKAGQKKGGYYRLEPYILLNKSGIWYLIGTSDGQRKTFCFSQTSAIGISGDTFEPDPVLQEEIRDNDSISHGNQIGEIVIQASPQAAHYFLRRKLLPNQEIVRRLDDGGLLLACRNVHEMEVVPIVQYWIPHLRIVSPAELQEKMEGRLKVYLPYGKTF